ncbi:hypothetical protein EDC04DRAFT_2533667, partial [Pisolithus marmoratus]
GRIMHQVPIRVQFKDHFKELVANVTDLGSHNMILGHMWLSTHNPEVNWKTSKISM